jgi:predicted nucleic acid-binding protein
VANAPRQRKARKPPIRLCWDACAWIALIIDEKVRDTTGTVIEDRGRMCRQVVAAAEKGVVEIATSALNLVEVCKSREVASGRDNATLRDFFEHDFVLLVSLERVVGDEARRLMLAGHAGLKPPDATHLATAIVARAAELHTFDTKLLKLDSRITGLDGTPLKICKPAVPAPPAPLLQATQHAT